MHVESFSDVEEFLGCKNASDFESLTTNEEGFPASHLWERSQSF
jgi:hypothetical protein